uniref:Uncharacterized protein n=1 Tax=Romanomermis culicivorax TaxID=13658 RepID=A0A915L7T4_ROMCU
MLDKEKNETYENSFDIHDSRRKPEQKLNSKLEKLNESDYLLVQSIQNVNLSKFPMKSSVKNTSKDFDEQKETKQSGNI